MTDTERLDIYNKALSVFNIAPRTEDDLKDTEGHPEIQTLDMFFPTALHRAMYERTWTFLEKRLELGDDLGAECGYRHSYDLPEGLLRLTRAEGIYRVVGTRLLMNGRPLAYGIMQTLPDSGVPELFYSLVAYALAVLVSPKLSPGDTKYQIAEGNYQRILELLVRNDLRNQMHMDRRSSNGNGYYV